MAIRNNGGRDPAIALGLALEEHIAAWVRRFELGGAWARRSDIHERLMAEVEKIVIRAALEKTGGVKSDAADFLGISRNTLARKARRYGLDGSR